MDQSPRWISWDISTWVYMYLWTSEEWDGGKGMQMSTDYVTNLYANTYTDTFANYNNWGANVSILYIVHVYDYLWTCKDVQIFVWS